MNIKTCQSCNKDLPETDFYFRKGREKLTACCKECNRAKSRDWHKNNQEKSKQRDRNTKNRNPRRHWSKSTINHHKSRGYTILFSIDELLFIAKEVDNCQYCGKKLDWTYGNKGVGPRQDSPSLDNKDLKKEIKIEDCDIICNECNVTKGRRTKQEFINYCKNIGEKEWL